MRLVDRGDDVSQDSPDGSSELDCKAVWTTARQDVRISGGRPH